MKRVLVSVLLISTATLAGVRVYDIAPHKDLHGLAMTVTESYTLTCDSLLWAEVFIGQLDPTKVYDFTFSIVSEQTGTIRKGVGSTEPGFGGYKFVRLPLHPLPAHPVPMPPKGTRLTLKVTCEVQQLPSAVPFYYDERDSYKYGELSVGSPPVPMPGCDLAARIEGLVWRNEDMISMWNLLPAQLYDGRSGRWGC